MVNHLPGPTRYRIMLLGISKSTMPRESICWPTLNWFWVMPTSTKKSSVRALAMFPRSSSIYWLDCIYGEWRVDLRRQKNPSVNKGMIIRSSLEARSVFKATQSGNRISLSLGLPLFFRTPVLLQSEAFFIIPWDWEVLVGLDGLWVAHCSCVGYF